MGMARRVTEGPRAGWSQWVDPVPDTFLSLLGPVYSRSIGDRTAMVELDPRPDHRNRGGALHGGFLAAFADHAYFSGLFAMGRQEQAGAVTVDLSMQYLAAAQYGEPLRAEVELLAETGRLLFMRMTMLQSNGPVGASTATLRKVPTPR